MTSLLLREVCAGIGTRIKSPITAKHAGKGQEVERPKYIYACMSVNVVYSSFFYLYFNILLRSLVCLVFVSVLGIYFFVFCFSISLYVSYSIVLSVPLLYTLSLTSFGQPG